MKTDLFYDCGDWLLVRKDLLEQYEMYIYYDHDPGRVKPGYYDYADKLDKLNLDISANSCILPEDRITKEE